MLNDYDDNCNHNDEKRSNTNVENSTEVAIIDNFKSMENTMHFGLKK